MIFNGDGSTSNNTFVGSIRDTSFIGASLTNVSETLRIDFSSVPAEGSYLTITSDRPPKTETISFTATQIFATAK